MSLEPGKTIPLAGSGIPSRGCFSLKLTPEMMAVFQRIAERSEWSSDASTAPIQLLMRKNHHSSSSSGIRRPAPFDDLSDLFLRFKAPLGVREEEVEEEVSLQFLPEHDVDLYQLTEEGGGGGAKVSVAASAAASTTGPVLHAVGEISGKLMARQRVTDAVAGRTRESSLAAAQLLRKARHTKVMDENPPMPPPARSPRISSSAQNRQGKAGPAIEGPKRKTTGSVPQEGKKQIPHAPHVQSKPFKVPALFRPPPRPLLPWEEPREEVYVVLAEEGDGVEEGIRAGGRRSLLDFSARDVASFFRTPPRPHGACVAGAGGGVRPGKRKASSLGEVAPPAPSSCAVWAFMHAGHLQDVHSSDSLGSAKQTSPATPTVPTATPAPTAPASASKTANGGGAHWYRNPRPRLLVQLREWVGTGVGAGASGGKQLASQHAQGWDGGVLLSSRPLPAPRSRPPQHKEHIEEDGGSTPRCDWESGGGGGVRVRVLPYDPAESPAMLLHQLAPPLDAAAAAATVPAAAAASGDLVPPLPRPPHLQGTCLGPSDLAGAAAVPVVVERTARDALQAVAAIIRSCAEDVVDRVEAGAPVDGATPTPDPSSIATVAAVVEGLGSCHLPHGVAGLDLDGAWGEDHAAEKGFPVRPLWKFAQRPEVALALVDRALAAAAFRDQALHNPATHQTPAARQSASDYSSALRLLATARRVWHARAVAFASAPRSPRVHPSGPVDLPCPGELLRSMFGFS